MASSIEDILYAKALADAEKRPDPAVAMGGGAAVGGILGALPGIGGARGRMAGGLIGAITGGALGSGVANMFAQSSPAGNMLARVQATRGDISSMDKVQLESILADIYNNPGM
jgi:outer membrane lipoprotein SlyB